jgi:hypothetical protein
VGLVPVDARQVQRLTVAAVRLPAGGLPAKSQFCRPSAMGRTWFSTQLFETGTSPSLTMRVSSAQLLRLQSMACILAELGGTGCLCVSSQRWNIAGTRRFWRYRIRLRSSAGSSSISRSILDKSWWHR